MRLGHLLIGKLASLNIDSANKRWLFLAGFGEAVFGDEFDVGKRHIRQRLSRSAGVSAGHISDAVVDDAFLGKHGIVMRGRTRGFRATALVDRDIDKN